MQTTSELYKTLWADSSTKCQTAVSIAGTAYTEFSIISLETSGGLYAKKIPAVGGAVSREIDLAFLPGSEVIPRMAEIRISASLVLDEQASEPLPKGVFYFDTRYLDETTGALVVHGYDAMLKAEDQYIPTDSPSGTWPRKMTTVVADICVRIGVTLDARTVINADWEVEYPSDMSMREILGYIAAAHVGNWTITDAGELYLVPLVPSGTPLDIGVNASDLKVSPAFDQFTGIQFHYDNKDTYFAGDNTGRVLEIECPWATRDIADAALAAVQGYVYRPYEATDAILDPAAELGDPVVINGTESVLASVSSVFGPLSTADIAAPHDEEVDHEYPFTDKQVAQTKREIAKAKAEIQVGIDEINATVEGVEGNLSQLQMEVDGITFKVTEKVGADGEVYAELTLGIGPNSYTGLIQMTGNLQVSGQLSADALYAAMGNIADLTVNRLRTDDWIKRYLARDMSDADYICIEGDSIEFRGAQTDGSIVQAKTPTGLALYWEANPDECTLASDGWPYLDGTRIFTTTAITEWPVYHYNYAESVKRDTHFEMVDGYMGVVDTFGAGDGLGGNRGWIVKSVDGLRIMFRTSNKEDLGVVMGNNGFTDIYGLRRTSFMDFSELPFGKFYEMVDGIDTEFSWSVNRDESGRPISVTDDIDGHVCQVRWWDET